MTRSNLRLFSLSLFIGKLNPCANGGTCLDLVNGFKCICAPGFTSKDCSTNINECESSPCMNDGQCIDKVNEFECACKSGFFGTLCEHRTDHRSPAEHKSKVKARLANSANQLPSTLESRPSAERLNSEQLILISIISLIVPLSALLIYVFLRYVKKRSALANQNNGLPCKSIEEVEVLRQNEANINLLNNSSTLNNNNNNSNFNCSNKLSNTAPGTNVIVNSLNKSSSVYSLNKAKSTMKLNNLNHNQLNNNNENIYTQHPMMNNYATQLRQQHAIYSTLNNTNRHSMYGMIGGPNNKTTFSTFVPQSGTLKQQQPLYATMKKSQQPPQFANQAKRIYESVQYATYGQMKADSNELYSTKQQALVYNIPAPNKQNKY